MSIASLNVNSSSAEKLAKVNEKRITNWRASFYLKHCGTFHKGMRWEEMRDSVFEEIVPIATLYNDRHAT